MAFPPVIVYPNALDSDRTLFLVYNTTEAALTVNNAPWSEELLIEAQDIEVWADNGFGNIEGELFYYDAVEKDSNGKVFKLKGCARNLGGRETQYNIAGTMVRGFVIATHHNQLVSAIINIETFVGVTNSSDQESLDYRIRSLVDI